MSHVSRVATECSADRVMSAQRIASPVPEGYGQAAAERRVTAGSSQVSLLSWVDPS